MRVTSKGQVTIPLPIRMKAGIGPGCDVEFHEEAGRIYLSRSPGSGRGQLLVKGMAGRGELRMSTDEILALTRGSSKCR